jgi:predicted ATPase/DNA-binding winged helix-turn-helix (wHTH) protein
VDNEAFVFGPFRLMPAQRMLLADGKPLPLGSRALEILIALVERAGEIVSKEELITRVWPNTHVEEGSLRVHVASLRKALGDGRAGNRYIANIPIRGYRFVAPVTLERKPPVPPPPTEARPRNYLPTPLTRIIGRDDTVAALPTQLARRRLLTIVGPAGMGKTAVAIAVAGTVRSSYPDGVWFVGLSSLPGPDLVPSAVIAALGISLSGGNLVSGLTAWLRNKQALIVLDSCEHVISAAASIAEVVLKAAPRVCILATSREPLLAEGEWLHRLHSLELPPNATDLTANEAMQYSAVQLFVERAMASADGFDIADADVPAVLEICRSLDGMPLALELAAARVDAFGIKGLAARLDDRFTLLTGGRRTALPRHQTLRAAMDWSYDLLPDAEKVILRRLAVFHGDFTMDAAQAVAADGEIVAGAVFDGVASLAAKSLLAADISGEITHYRLLDTTQAYSRDKLVEAGEIGAIRRRHAEYHCDLFRKAEREAAARPGGNWPGEYAYQIGNLRAALDWCFSDTGDARLGVTLAAVATDFWLTFSPLSECCDWAAKALGHLGAAEGTREEMVLQCGLGLALTYVRGMTEEARSALTRALTLSEALSDLSCRFRALYGLWLFSLRVADCRQCLALAHQYELLAESIDDPAASAVADWMLGMSRYQLAEYATAAVNLQRAIESYPMAMRSSDLLRFGVHMKVSALSYQAVTFWSLGFADRAIRVGQDAIQEARSVNHPVSLGIALNLSSILLVKVGDLDAAERCIDELIDHADKHSLIPSYAAGLCSKGNLMAARGDLVAAERWLRSGLERRREVGYYFFYAFFLSKLAEVLACAGRIEEGLVEIDAALRHARETESLWCMPEVLRIKGSILAKHNEPVFAAASDHFTQGLKLARRQDALSWELRCATSLARLLRDQGRCRDATAQLRPVYDRFTEGFVTADLKTAKVLLDDLSADGRSMPAVSANAKAARRAYKKWSSE